MDLTFLFPLLGWTGALCTISGYGLLTLGRLTPTSRLFQGLNIAGSVMLCSSAAFSAAWPSASVNLLWALIGLLGWIHFARTKANATPAAEESAVAPAELLLTQPILIRA